MYPVFTAVPVLTVSIIGGVIVLSLLGRRSGFSLFALIAGSALAAIWTDMIARYIHVPQNTVITDDMVTHGVTVLLIIAPALVVFARSPKIPSKKGLFGAIVFVVTAAALVIRSLDIPLSHGSSVDHTVMTFLQDYSLYFALFAFVFAIFDVLFYRTKGQRH